MVMLEITMEVSVNIGLPLKGRAQAWLGLSLLGTFRHCKVLFSSSYAGRCSHGFPTCSEVCAFVWGIFVRGLRVETFVRVLRSSRCRL